jgi:ubiquinone/menaquinone biosynthesis C-methylase UbiE
MEFKDDKSYVNLELGAGCGNFGAIYFYKCYLTDGDDERLKDRCKVNSINFFCKAHQLPWGNDRFEKVIMCNPYLYGFKDYEDSVPLLAEIIRVLKKTGIFIIIGSKGNNYCIEYKIEKTIEKTRLLYPNFTCDLVAEEIDSSKEYNNYIFKRMDNSETKPTKRFTLTIIKN